MSITNQSKPVTDTSSKKLNVGSGFTLLVGGIYKLIVGSATTGGGFTNTNKASIGETWGTISTTYASETRTWLAVSQLFGNTSKPSTSLTNESKPA